MDDPRKNLLTDLEIKTCKVKFSTSPIVLLCGGKVKQKLYPEAKSPPIQSLRHAISLESTDYEIFRPEEITTWQFDAVFKNLMDFEKDLASICSLVVIILESAGAIAELGAFSQLVDLSKKLIVIRSDDYSNDSSFINLGILRYIRAVHPTSIKSYPWKIDTPQDITPDIIDDVIKDVQLELDSLNKTETFNLNNGTHVMVLICELITLLVALKITEILKYLTDFGVTITLDELKGKIFLLQEFRIIRIAEYGDSVFYIRGQEDYHKLRLTAKKDKTIDALRIPIESIEYYKTNTSDRHRSQAIKKASTRTNK